MMKSARPQHVMKVLDAVFRQPQPYRWLAVAVLLAAAGISWWRAEPSAVPDRAAPTAEPVASELVTSRGDSEAVGSVTVVAGRLIDVGRGVLRSPAGLQYTRGSGEGHRIRHVMTHSQDRPDRPGQHGVFAESRQESIVALIDQAYLQAQRGERTRRQVDQGRTILTIDVGHPIGFIGGQVGNRRGRPPARHLRLVLEDQRVITAYPVIP